LVRFAAAREAFGAKIAAFGRFRPRFLAPKPAILMGLRDPVSGLGMGEAADRVGREWERHTPLACDAFAAELAASRPRGARADGAFGKSSRSPHRTGSSATTTASADSAPEKLAALPPRFDRVHGLSTAGNASQISDWAVALVLASDAFLRARGRVPHGYLEAHAVAGLEPERFALGPSSPSKSLHRGRVFELRRLRPHRNQRGAFSASQMLARLAASEDAEFARRRFGSRLRPRRDP
jgi:acetyl-CoA C-acetyltransferase/acetyl-CoA acyltransferase